MPAEPRRFPLPWRAVEIAGGWSVVDASGFTVCYVYGEDNVDRARAANLMSRDEARLIAVNIAKRVPPSE